MGNEMAMRRQLESMEAQYNVMVEHQISLGRKIKAFKESIKLTFSDRSKLAMDVERLKLQNARISSARQEAEHARQEAEHARHHAVVDLKKVMSEKHNLVRKINTLEANKETLTNDLKVVGGSFKRASTARDKLLAENKNLKKRKFNDEDEQDVDISTPLFSSKINCNPRRKFSRKR